MTMGQIEEIKQGFTEGVNIAHGHKKAATKTLLNNAGILVGVFIVFAVITIVTTDIKLADPEKFGQLGIDFFLLLFCTYSMYINCSDSGMRLGLRNEDYLAAVELFEDRKNVIKENKFQKKMYEFCRYYINKELENTKMNILMVVGFDYETYIDNFVGKSDEFIQSIDNLTKPQKDAIIKANAIKPIKLTPEMILMRGRKTEQRSPLGITPQQKKAFNFGFKFISNLVIALFWTAIVIEFAIEPTWQLFVAIILRSLLIILNGFSGYKFGYENIVFDTTNYMNDQTDLMEQALQYFEENNKDENGIQIKVI